MPRSRKSILVIALFSVLALVFAGCGDDSTPEPTKFSISGQVTLDADGVEGVTVIATGTAGSGAAATDAGGNYAITGLADGDYTVTAAKAGYTCIPAGAPVTISGANVTAVDFTATGALSISGSVINGVVLTLGGDGSGTTISSGGTYAFTNLVPGNYTVTPKMHRYIFSEDWSGTLTDTDVTNANFTATPGYMISGAITNSVTFAPLEGVTVDLSGDDTGFTNTASDGTYAFINVPDGNYTVTPGLSDYAFTPISNTVDVSGADVTGIDFTGRFVVTYGISGKVTYDTGSGVIGLKGVTVNLSGGATGSTTTDAAGNYAFAGLEAGLSYTVSPDLTGYTFAPWTGTLNADVTNDFAATGPCYSVNGSIYILSGGGPLSGATMTLDTAPELTTTTNGSGFYSTACIPNGTYTLTPSLSGANAVFFPAEKSEVIAGGGIWGEDFTADVRYSVSGTVDYSGPKTGRVYVNAEWSGGGSTGVGTSIDYPTEDTFIINGVQAGSYTITAYMDHLGGGGRVASNPTGSTGTITVSGDMTGQDITLTDPAPVTPAVPGGIMAYPSDGAALVFWDSPRDSSDLEIAESYNVYWGTSPLVNATTYSGTDIVPAGLDTPIYLRGGLSNGSVYYFTVTAVTGGVESAESPVSLPVTIGATTGANTISGAITFSGAATGPMIAGVYQDNPGGAPKVYLDYIPSPASPQAYSVSGVPDGNYGFFAIIDMNANGRIDAGDMESSPDEDEMITVSGSTTHNVTIVSANAFARVATEHQADVANDWYSLEMRVDDGMKLVVKVTLNAGQNVPGPIDVGKREWGDFSSWFWLNDIRPGVGDSYSFVLTYSDGTTETIPGSVTAVLDSFATLTYPVGIVPGATHPTFTWTAPASPPAAYSYRIGVLNSSWNDVWHFDGDIPSSETSIEFNVDDSASEDPLTGGADYYWQLSVEDAAGNRATYRESFTP